MNGKYATSGGQASPSLPKSIMTKVKVNETGGAVAQRKVMNETDLSLLNLLGPKKDNMLSNSISDAIPYYRNSSIDQPKN